MIDADARYASYCASESDFIRAYIFPEGTCSVGAMQGAAKLASALKPATSASTTR